MIGKMITVKMRKGARAVYRDVDYSDSLYSGIITEWHDDGRFAIKLHGGSIVDLHFDIVRSIAPNPQKKPPFGPTCIEAMRLVIPDFMEREDMFSSDSIWMNGIQTKQYYRYKFCPVHLTDEQVNVVNQYVADKYPGQRVETYHNKPKSQLTSRDFSIRVYRETD